MASASPTDDGRVVRIGPAILTWANALTFARLLLLPLVMWGICRDHGWVAFLAMFLVLLTDLVDGRVARRLGHASEFGKTLDSTIDFTLIYCTFIAIWASKGLPTWKFAFIYLAMLAILTQQLVSIGRGDGSITKTSLSKVTGALQYFYLLFLVFSMVLPKGGFVAVLDGLLFALVALSVVLYLLQIGFRLSDELGKPAAAEAPVEDALAGDVPPPAQMSDEADDVLS